MYWLLVYVCRKAMGIDGGVRSEASTLLELLLWT